MSFIAPTDTAAEKKELALGPEALLFGLSILTFLPSEKAETLPHTHLKKECISLIFENCAK